MRATVAVCVWTGVLLLACAGQGTGGETPSPASSPRSPADDAPSRTGALIGLPGDQILSYGVDEAHLWRPEAGWTTISTPPTRVSGPRGIALTSGHALVVGDGPVGLLYDPATATWTPTSGSTRPLGWTDVVVLLDGGVLAMGGGRCDDGQPVPGWRLDPATATWSPLTGPVPERVGGAAVVVADGRVLVTGGSDACGPYGPPTATTSWFDPATGAWSEGPKLLAERAEHEAIALPDGDVLLLGGPGTTPSAEVIDLPSGVSRAVDYPGPNAGFTVVKRVDGAWWVFGGRRDRSLEDTTDEVLSEVWVLDPGALVFRPGPPLPVSADFVRVAELADGRLVLGGFPAGVPTSVEVLPSP